MSRQLEIGLFDRLTGQTNAGTRVHPYLLQNPTYPVIRYMRVSTERMQSLTENVGVAEASIQVDSIAETYDAAKTLADQVRTRLHGYTGTWSTLICRFCHLETEADLEYRDGDKKLFTVSQRYRIHTNMD